MIEIVDESNTKHWVNTDQIKYIQDFGSRQFIIFFEKDLKIVVSDKTGFTVIQMMQQ